MIVDFIDYIVSGTFGEVYVGLAWERVGEILGKPELYEPPSEHAPGFARYFDLELTIREGVIVVISLSVDTPKIVLPGGVEMIHFDDPNPDVDEVGTLLRERGVAWEKIEILSDDWQETFRTERGVHLAFGGGLLAKIGAASPEKRWGA